MTRGFIILRHVINEETNQFWKECYLGIRQFHEDPILIIDDSSNREYLVEDITLTNCTVISDTENKGVAEFLPYHYFYTLKPFDEAVILHDSVFVQKPVELSLSENVQFLWTIPQTWDNEIFPRIDKLLSVSPHHKELCELYHRKEWKGCFGAMSVIRWDFLQMLYTTHRLDGLLTKIKERDDRSAWERVLGLLCSYHTSVSVQHGNIFHYMRFGISYQESRFAAYRAYPLLKVWTGR